MGSVNRKSIRTSQLEMGQDMERCISAINMMMAEIGRVHQLLSYTTKRVETLYGLLYNEKKFTSDDIENGYKVWREFFGVLNFCSTKKNPLKDRIANLVEWNKSHESFFYISPSHSGIDKELQEYTGEDKAMLEEQIKDYLEKEDTDNIVNTETPEDEENPSVQ